MKRILTVLALIAGTLTLGLSAAQASTSAKPEATELEKVQAYVGPSIVNLQIAWTAYVYDGTNKAIMKNITGDGSLQEFSLNFQCTGYVINPSGYIATAGHCVDPAQVRDAFFEQAAQWAAQCGCYYGDTSLSAETILGFSDAWTLKYYNKDDDAVKNGPSRDAVMAAWSQTAGGVEVGKQVPARVVKFQKFSNGDGAVLKVDQDGLFALPLNEKAPEIGSKVVAVGFPGSVDQVTDPDLEPSYKDGSLGSKSTEGGGLTSVYEISAATSGGMSGGPVVDLEGEVLGFVDFKNATETQAFNFMRPSSTILELLPSDAGNELDPLAKAYRAGLDAYFDGDKAAAVKNLQEVVDEQPTNKFATKYLKLAKKLPTPPKPKSSFPILPVGLGVVALVVIGGAAAFFLSRRGKGNPPAGGAPTAMGGPVAPVAAAPVPPPPPAAPAPAAPAAPMAPTATALADPPAPPGAPAAPAAPAPAVPASSAPEQTQPIGFSSPPPPPPPVAAPAPEPAAPAPEPVAQVSEVAPASTGFCGNCGAAQEAGKRFCSSCGTAY